MALHSGIFKYNLKTLLGLFLFSILSLKLDYLVYGSNSSKMVGKTISWMKMIKNKVIFNGIEQIEKKKRNHL